MFDYSFTINLAELIQRMCLVIAITAATVLIINMFKREELPDIDTEADSYGIKAVEPRHP